MLTLECKTSLKVICDENRTKLSSQMHVMLVNIEQYSIYDLFLMLRFA